MALTSGSLHLSMASFWVPFCTQALVDWWLQFLECALTCQELSPHLLGTWNSPVLQIELKLFLLKKDSMIAPPSADWAWQPWQTLTARGTLRMRLCQAPAFALWPQTTCAQGHCRVTNPAAWGTAMHWDPAQQRISYKLLTHTTTLMSHRDVIFKERSKTKKIVYECVYVNSKFWRDAGGGRGACEEVQERNCFILSGLWICARTQSSKLI